uniref:site-specific integrase n=1 Tax=Enterocloster aldenensis TaxID=358742 RepID=UPI002E796C9E
MKKATPVGAGMTFHIDSLPDAPEDITLLNNQIISFLERSGKRRVNFTKNYERGDIMPVYPDEERGTFYCKFYYKDWTGQNRQKLKRGFTRKKDARDWERDFLTKHAGSPNMAFKSLCELYLEDAKQSCKLSSYKIKKSICETHILPYFKDKSIDKISPSDVRKWQNVITESVKSEVHQKNVSQQFSSIMNFAVRYYGLRKNPCSAAGSIGKRKARKMDFWTLEEFNRFIANVNDLPLKIAFQILFYTGLRIGELLALTLSDLDLSSKTLTINKTYHRYEKADMITTPKTDNSNRNVTLPSFLVEVISDYINKNYDVKPENRLFPQVTEYKLRYWKNAVCRVSGVKVIRLHDIRHSHVSLLIDMGFSPYLIAERIGDTVQMVNEVYGHLYPNRHIEVADRLQKQYQSSIT